MCGAVARTARSQERETKAKRMRPPSLNDQRTPLSRGPSGLPRSGKSGKNSSSTSVETTGHLSVRALEPNPPGCRALAMPTYRSLGCEIPTPSQEP